MAGEKGKPDNNVMFGSIGVLLISSFILWFTLFLLGVDYSFLWVIAFLFGYPLLGRALVFCSYKVYLAYKKAGGDDSPEIFNRGYPNFVLLGSVTPFATVLILIYWLLAYFLTLITGNR
jgi:hypothetical protein